MAGEDATTNPVLHRLRKLARRVRNAERGDEIPLAVAMGSLIALAAKGGGQALKYVTQVVFARWLGLEDFGVFSLVTHAAQLLAVFGGLGFTTAVLRYLPQYAVQEQWARFRAFLRFAHLSTWAASVLVGAAAAALVLALRPGAYPAAAILVGALLVPLFAIVKQQANTLRSLHEVTWAYMPSHVGQPVVALALAGAVVLAGRFSLAAALWTTAGSLAMAAVAGRLLVLWRLPPGARTPEAKAGRAQRREWLGVAFSMLLVSGFVVALNQMDILLVGALRGPAEAGLYAAATKTSDLPQFILASTNALAAPMVARYHARGDKTSLQRVLSSTVSWTFWPSLVLGVLLVLFGDEVLALFGGAFREAHGALLILVGATVFNAMMGPVGSVLAMTGHQKDSARVYAVSAVVSLGLNLALIPKWGILGAAAATAATIVLWNVWLAWLVHARLGVHCHVLARFFVAKGAP